ncbi:ICMT-domain-containing protein [Aspergillus steynii IBT 23096]|uniref:Protein-S-isoprenylcysteine O-methyltransferase n=1 Tax=Aspergillus steynii IBT 23096 TaxID=1392250 RepID=A0A2I2G2J2_9EURO|nr:ICMT-domain-containing protein [Aspergillus steynii IBT 23096]PLB47099.1 ICMT-domain-containing protein [Aspergillus steynii IBT 23096]
MPSTSPPLDTSIYPGGKKSLAGISLRAFLIGTTLGLSASLALTLRLFSTTPLWRIPFFLASLCLFHFLEYYVTAAHNTRHASVSAFLLSSNGWAYNLAHTSAALECLLAHVLFWPRESYFAWSGPVFAGLKIQLVLGLLLMAVGQTTRTLAMAQAGSNFNHTVQVERKDGHTLVTHGVYALLRHPSYFGFFWWGLGTQLVLGNVVCFVGYLVVLWKFFNSRIQREERFLIAFFGDEYVQYKKRSIVGIPGIW